jgi:hypothetical protein
MCNFFSGETLVSEAGLILIKPITNITPVSSECSMRIFFPAFKIKLLFFVANEFVPCL